MHTNRQAIQIMRLRVSQEIVLRAIPQTQDGDLPLSTIITYIRLRELTQILLQIVRLVIKAISIIHQPIVIRAIAEHIMEQVIRTMPLRDFQEIVLRATPQTQDGDLRLLIITIFIR